MTFSVSQSHACLATTMLERKKRLFALHFAQSMDNGFKHYQLDVISSVLQPFNMYIEDSFAQYVKCLLHKHEVLILISRIPFKARLGVTY